MFWSSLTDFWNRFIYETIQKNIRLARAHKELNSLSDKELRDLGINSRSQIPYIIYNTSLK